MPRHFISCSQPECELAPAVEIYAKEDGAVRLCMQPESAIKTKKLRFARDTQPGVLIEQFEHFCVLTSFDASAKIDALSLQDYEGLKASLVYGLKAGAAGLSGVDAARVFIYYLLCERAEEAGEFLVMVGAFLGANEAALRAKDELDLLAICLDAQAFFEQKSLSYNELVEQMLGEKYSKNQEKLLLQFVKFFKPHKKIKSLADAKKMIKKLTKNK